MIIDSTDKLLAKWRLCSPETVRLDIVRQSKNLLLHIFGYIAFDYNLNTLDDDDTAANNDLAWALQELLDLVQNVLRTPDIINLISLKLNFRYRRAQAIFERYCNEIIEHELAESPESIAQRKRQSLIASLVSSLQQDEQTKAKTREEDKKGQFASFKTLILFYKNP